MKIWVKILYVEISNEHFDSILTTFLSQSLIHRYLNFFIYEIWKLEIAKNEPKVAQRRAQFWGYFILHSYLFNEFK